MPYLTIDPTDIGREYREVIRVNSQSGKGGVAYLLENEYGIELPKEMQREFGPIANEEVDRLGREVSGAELKGMFWREYIERTAPWQLQGFETESRNGTVRCRARLLRDGKPVELSGEGNGPLAALVHGFSTAGVPRFEIVELQRARPQRRRRSGRHRLHPDQAQQRAHPLGRRRGHQYRTRLRARRAQRAESVVTRRAIDQRILFRATGARTFLSAAAQAS